MKKIFLIIFLILFLGCSSKEYVYLEKKCYYPKLKKIDENLTFVIKGKISKSKNIVIIEKKEFYNLINYIKKLKKIIKFYNFEITKYNNQFSEKNSK